MSFARAVERNGDYRIIYANYRSNIVYKLETTGSFSESGHASQITDYLEKIACVVYMWAMQEPSAKKFLASVGLRKHRIPIILDTIDAIISRQYRSYKSTMWQRPQINLPLSTEIEYLDKADFLIAITPEEKALFGMLSETPGVVVSYADPSDGEVSGKVASRDRSKKKSFISGFLGSQNDANYQAAIRSCHVAWMSGKVSSFHLAGTVCRYGDLTALLENRYGGWLSVRGVIENPKTFYDSLDFTTSILPYGSGIKIKVIESLAHNRPVIGNHIALEGLTDFSEPNGALARAETYLEYRDILEIWQKGTAFSDLDPLRIARRQSDRFQSEVKTFLDTLVASDPLPRPRRFGRTRLRQIIAGITRSGGR